MPKKRGVTRSKACFSDNWFKMRRREKGFTQIQADRKKAVEAEANGRASLAERVFGYHSLCKHITRRPVADLLSNKVVTPDQVQTAGLEV
jgi:hypothetical protein